MRESVGHQHLEAAALKDGRNGPAIEWERNKRARRKARGRARVLESGSKSEQGQESARMNIE